MLQCLDCESVDLRAIVHVVKYLPLGARGGSVKVGGNNVTQMDLKNQWDKEDVRGPIVCLDCGAEHHYVVGSKKPLRLGRADEAREVDIEQLRALDG